VASGSGGVKADDGDGELTTDRTGGLRVAGGSAPARGISDEVGLGGAPPTGAYACASAGGGRRVRIDGFVLSSPTSEQSLTGDGCSEPVARSLGVPSSLGAS